MSKITDIYMNLDGEQVHLSMSQFREMREKQPELKKLRFIPIDNCMYQATAKQYLEWEKDNNRRKYLSRVNSEITMLSIDSDKPEDSDFLNNLIDETADVEDEVATSILYEALRKAFSQLAEDEKALISALVIEGITVRKYAEITGIPVMTIQDRKVRTLRKIKKTMVSKK